MIHGRVDTEKRIPTNIYLEIIRIWRQHSDWSRAQIWLGQSFNPLKIISTNLSSLRYLRYVRVSMDGISTTSSNYWTTLNFKAWRLSIILVWCYSDTYSYVSSKTLSNARYSQIPLKSILSKAASYRNPGKVRQGERLSTKRYWKKR